MREVEESHNERTYKNILEYREKIENYKILILRIL